MIFFSRIIQSSLFNEYLTIDVFTVHRVVKDHKTEYKKGPIATWVQNNKIMNYYFLRTINVPTNYV